MKTKPNLHLSALLACVLAAGCATQHRSISNSSFRAEDGYCSSDPSFSYRGELSEFDVLGISRGEIASDADIRHTLDESKALKLRPGTSILLIQSGAPFPDAPMVAGLGKYFSVVPFSGLPSVRRSGSGDFQTESLDPESFARSLRLTAARGGNDFILCYWGTLESESERLPTKTISWVPLINWFFPDQVQHGRIRLKLALVDVRSGQWSLFSPPAFESQRLSLAPRREAVDQHLVERLKGQAYEAAIQELVRNHSQLASAK